MADQEPVLFLVFRGLLEHKDRMGAAIWEYLWFLDRVTQDNPDGSGKFIGLVLGGKPITAAQIASELREHINTAKANIALLEREGYIVRTMHSDNTWSAIVTNSKKWFWSRTPRTENCATLAQKPVRPRTETCTSNKERHDIDTTKTKGASFDASKVFLPSWLPPDAWQEFAQHRKDQRNPLTELAAKKIIRRLETFRSEGHDPRAVIDQTIGNGWTGVFPISEHKGSNSSSKPAQVEYLSDRREKARLQ